MTDGDITEVKAHLEYLREDMKIVVEAIRGTDSKPGLLLDVDRLKQKEAQRTWLIRTLGVALCGLGLESLATRLGWF